MMEATANAGKACVPPIKLILMRELVSKTNTLRTLNSKILKANITATNGMTVLRSLFLNYFSVIDK